MTDFLSGEQDFSLLSLQDLLEARDFYHYHLLNKRNVVATAVGRYLIRRDEPWPDRKTDPQTGGTPRSVRGARGPRTLENSEVRSYSWPCVLVFVDRWAEPAAFGRGDLHNDDFIDRSISLRKKTVPICVVQASKVEISQTVSAPLTFPETYLGGGYPLIATVQGQEHVASIGCLVSDGHTTYALTNRHVSGRSGESIDTLLKGERVTIGKTSDKQLTRAPFTRVYEGWPGEAVYVNQDIGLVELTDLDRWTAQVYGIGQIGALANLNTGNIDLKLIGCPVKAYGCASGSIRGALHALFYRFKAVGGSEYVADFLIGPRKDPTDPTGQASLPFGTQPGDSGTVYLLETDRDATGLMPIAVQWGGHVFQDGATRKQMPYALATCLSAVCDALDVRVVRDLNLGLDDYWGAVGHYTIATRACDAVEDPDLRVLMDANVANISYRAGDITGKTGQGLTKAPFVPLADVPDMVWKAGKAGQGGRGGPGSPEHANHFADMDRPRPADGQTLLQLCEADPANVAVPVWQAYYTNVGDTSRGLLPFRVQQIFRVMVQAAQEGDLTRFVAASGVVSHYVGDACQPLHISYKFNGDPDTGEGAGVHSAYEADMVNFHVVEIKQGIDAAVLGAVDALPAVDGLEDAARAVVDLMRRTFATIEPGAIIQSYVAADPQNTPKRQVADALWADFGAPTITVMTLGARYLALLWDAAWRLGRQAAGGAALAGDLGAVAQDDLVNLYKDTGFLPSVTLDHIADVLAAPPR